MKICFFLFLLIVFYNPLFGNEKKKVKIEWSKVPTAERYILEIRNVTKQTIYKKESTSNFQELELEIGEYEQKIYVINKLDEVESESDWEIFKVSNIVTPEISQEKTIIFNQLRTEIQIEGKNFHPDMKVKLRRGEKIYILEKSKVNSQNSANLVVNPEIPEGEYDLILENPKKSRVYPKLVKKESFTKEEDVTRQEKPRQVTSKTKKWEIVKRSAVLSGWGEYYAGNVFENTNYNFRGKLYFGSFLTFTLLYLYFNEFTIVPGSKTPTQKKFEADTTKNLGTAFLMPNLSNNSRRIAALYGLNEMNRQAELVNTQSQRVNLMLLFMAGVYITQLVDAFLIEKKENLAFDFKQPMLQVSFGNRESTNLFQIQFNLRF